MAVTGFALLACMPIFASAAHIAGHTVTPTAPPDDSTTEQYEFSQEGIFGCNQTAGAGASAGTLAAIGGTYVPVNDAAVTLNTGILVYKECVLRPLQDRLRESATSALLKKQYIGIETGREGNKRYVVNIPDDLEPIEDRAALTYLQSPFKTVHPLYRDKIPRALAINYRAETRGSEEQECGYKGDLAMATQNPTENEFSFENFAELRDPACNLFFAYMEKKDAMDAVRAEAIANQKTIWDWGRGFYAVTDNDQDPFKEKILTPSSVVQESFQQILGSPVRQLESANDIGQMIGALFASVTTQALTDSQGLAGLGRSIGGGTPYIDQVSRDSSQGVIDAAVNAAITILNAAKQVEGRFLAVMNSIAENLTQTINAIRGIERQCWALVVPKVKEYAGQNGITLDPAKISRSTSTLAFSQQVIDSQITPLAEAALENVESAQKAVSLIDRLIAGVTNTNSVAAQRLALQQLDTLVAGGSLHSQYDVANATTQVEDIRSAMDTLRTDTAEAWGDSPDPSIGWCNIQNPTVIRLWAERWKR